MSEIKHVDPVEMKISSFINALNHEIDMGRESSVFSGFSDIKLDDGTRAGLFWFNHAPEIQNKLIEEYKKLKNKKELTSEEKDQLFRIYKAINVIKEHKFASNVDAQIKSFIETITKETPDIYYGENIFSPMRKTPIYFVDHPDIKISPYFWRKHRKEIISKLFVDEEYQDSKYDKTRELVKIVCKRKGMILPDYIRPTSYADKKNNDNHFDKEKLIDNNSFIEKDLINSNPYIYDEKTINNSKKF